PDEPGRAPVVHDEAHALDLDDVEERADEPRVALDREVAVAALAGAAEAREVRRDAARALEERQPVVAARRDAVEVEDRRSPVVRLGVRRAPEEGLLVERRGV